MDELRDYRNRSGGDHGRKRDQKAEKDAQITMISADEQVHSRCMLHKYLSHERTAEELSFVEEDFFEKIRSRKYTDILKLSIRQIRWLIQREENRSVMTNCSFPQGQTVLFLL